MSGLGRRARASAGQLVLLGVLAAAAALLVTGLPRVTNDYLDRGLRADIAALPPTSRDLTFISLPRGYRPAPANPALLPAPLPGLVSQDWVTVRVGPARVSTGGDAAPFSGRCPPNMSVRWITGADRAVKLVAGRAPASGSDVEAIISRTSAAAIGVRVGATFRLSGSLSGGVPATVRVVGVYDERAPADPIWDGTRIIAVPCPDPADGVTAQVNLLTDVAGVYLAANRTSEVVGEWRYRLDERRLTTRNLPDVAAGVAAAKRTRPHPGTTLATSLDAVLDGFRQQQDAVAALLAIVRAGLLATLFGLVALAAGLVTQRRAAEFALIRARGGAAVTVGARVLAETALVAPAAVAAGGLAGLALPGRPDPYAWLALVVIALVTTFTTPVRVAYAQRRPAFTVRRDDQIRRRPRAGVLVAQGFAGALAVAGVLLLRRRGLVGDDPYLVVVPVLLALTVAVVVRYAALWALRVAAVLAARARGAVPFLGLAGAGRSGGGFAPVAVLVIAVATGVFTGVVTGTVGDARDRAADVQVAGDARITGTGFAASTAGRLAAVPGVTAVAGVYTGLTALRTGDAQVRLVALDGPAVQRVLRLSGSSLRLPDELARPGRIDGPVPAIISPDLVPTLGRGGAIDVRGVTYRFRVAAVAAVAPGLEVGAHRFVVLPVQALPVPAQSPIPPNMLLVAGAHADPGALRAAGAAGQLAYLAGPGGRPPPAWSTPPTTVVTWAAERAALQRGGVNQVLTFTFAAGAAGAVALALLTVGFTVLAGAGARARTLARLRTLGLTGGQGRRLLLYELVPLLAVAVLAGGAAGVALPPLIGPAMGLSRFTAGIAAGTHVDPLLVVATLGVVVLAVAAALLVESAVRTKGRGR